MIGLIYTPPLHRHRRSFIVKMILSQNKSFEILIFTRIIKNDIDLQFNSRISIGMFPRKFKYHRRQRHCRLPADPSTMHPPPRGML